jgi:hypothetical protein
MTQARIDIEYTNVWQHEEYCWYHPGIGMWWDGSRGMPTNNRHAKSTYRDKETAEKYHPHYHGYPSSKWELQCKDMGCSVVKMQKTIIVTRVS